MYEGWEDLTDKQQAYVKARAQGISKSGSYKIAYNTENMKPQTIANKATEVEKRLRPYIKDLIQDALDAKRKADIAEVGEVMEFFTQLMRGDIKEKIPVKTRKQTSKIDPNTGKKLIDYQDKITMKTVDASLKSRIHGAKGLERILVGSKVVIKDPNSEIDLTKISPEDLLLMRDSLKEEIEED